jgi:hypothetical protein
MVTGDFTMAKTRQQKQIERRKKYERERNLRHYQPRPKYILQVKDQGGWKPAMKFYSWDEVEKHEANIEDLRRRNAADITEAIVVEVKTGKQVKRIKPHSMKDPAFIGVQSSPIPEK